MLLPNFQPRIARSISEELREKVISGDPIPPELLISAANQIDGLSALFSLKIVSIEAEDFGENGVLTAIENIR